MNTNIAFLEGAIIAIAVLITSIFHPSDSGKNLFQVHIGVSFVIIGVCWLIYSIISACVTNFRHTLGSIYLAIVLIITGAIIAPEKEPLPSIDVIGNCDQSEWLITIKYTNLGYHFDKTYIFTGNTKQSDEAVMKLSEAWMWQNKDNKNIDYVETTKSLMWVPEEYLRKNNYPLDYSKRL
jgi:hypothetical protein